MTAQGDSCLHLCLQEEQLDVGATSMRLPLGTPDCQLYQIMQAILAEAPVCREIALLLFAQAADTLTPLQLARELKLSAGTLIAQPLTCVASERLFSEQVS
jgi:hypothetical protein